MKKNNALLVWKGRKLMCNGVCVAEIERWHWPKVVYWPLWFGRYNTQNNARCRMTEAAARRAVNRRFGLKD